MIDIQEIVDQVAAYNTTSRMLIGSLGLNSAVGKLRATKDPSILDKLDQSGFTKPGMNQSLDVDWDELFVKKLDGYKITQNLFLEYHGGTDKDQITIIPVEIEINFLAAFRKGMGSRNGHTQEFGGKWRHPFKIEMKPCQKVKA